MKKPIDDWNKFRKAFIVAALRRVSQRWPASQIAIKAARTTRQVNPKTGRLCWHVRCAWCHNEFVEKEIERDHIKPVVSVDVSEVLSSVRQTDVEQQAQLNLGAYLLRMLPEPSGYQALCHECHATKTRGENDARRLARSRGQGR